MSYVFSRKSWRAGLTAMTLAGLALGTFAQGLSADDKKSVKPKNTVKPANTTVKPANTTVKPKKTTDPYAVPDAKPAELLKFIAGLRTKRVRSLKEYLQKNRAAVTAADKILATKAVSEKNTIAAYKAKFAALSAMARYRDANSQMKLVKLAAKLKNHKNPVIRSLAEVQLLNGRIAALRTLDAGKRQQLLTDVIANLKKADINSFNTDTRTRFSLAMGLARGLERTRSKQLAASAYKQLAAILAKSKNEILHRYSAKMDGSARRINLLGNTIDIKGKTVDGKPFKWSDYKGKVVLVDFWATWCGPCVRELPNVKRMYKLYHDRGFEIVGISLDRSTSKARLQKFIKDHEVTWTNLFSPDPKATGWDHPMATYYGVMSIPNVILIDQKGKVVSLRARGTALQNQLAKLLGKVKETPGTKKTNVDK